MTTSDSRISSDLPVPPGEVLAKEIEDQGMTQKELAARLERPAQVINEIIKAKKAITADTAIGLEKALGIEAHYWSRLEADYRMSLARNRERGPARCRCRVAEGLSDRRDDRERLDTGRSG